MQQPRFYKTVPIGEKPKQPDLYHTLIEHEKLGIEGLPCHNNYIGDPNGGYWEIDGESKVTHYLQPIPIPDADRLRDVLSRLYKQVMMGAGVSIKMLSETEEALSNTIEGWVRVEDGNLPTEEGDYLCGYEYDLPGEKLFKQFVSKFGFYRLRQTGELNPDSDGITGCFTDHGNRAKLVTHWRPLPSPPQPINP